MIQRFWISWYQPTEDYRPIYPKGQAAPLAHRYWCSGQRCADDSWTMCAVVDADSEADAKAVVQRYWPEAKEWRFCEPRAADWLPGADRFPPPAGGEGTP